MRLAVSGSHSTGKSTLIAAFLDRHPTYMHEPEAFETLADDIDLTPSEGPTPEGLQALLEHSISAVSRHPPGSSVLFERSPVDYLAYASVNWLSRPPSPWVAKEELDAQTPCCRSASDQSSEHGRQTARRPVRGRCLRPGGTPPGQPEILMYFHCPAGSSDSVDIGDQETFLAASPDGLRFASDTRPLGPAYFRVFQWRDHYYSVVRAGAVLRSRDGRSPFEPGPTIIGPDAGRILRHAAVDRRGDTLRVYYSRIGDRPERILLSEVQLTPDWSQWRASEPVTMLSPERDYEGADRPLETSRPDEAIGRVRQLRDPAIVRDDNATYLLYSIAGESGLAIAKLPDR